MDEELALGTTIGILSTANLLCYEPGSFTPSWREPHYGADGLFAFLASLRLLQNFSPAEIKAKAAFLEHSRRAAHDDDEGDDADQNDNDKDELRELLSEYWASPPLSCTHKPASPRAELSSDPRAPLTSAHFLHDPEMQRLIAEYWAAPALGSSHSSYGL